ncbi:MAG: TRAP transporter large permease subunit [Trueperaceae bacterium]
MEYLALWMFLAAIVLLLIGFPVAFTLGGTAVLFTLVGSDLLGFLPWESTFRFARLNILPQRIYGTIMENYTLVAVPFFVFMGVMLEKSGLAEGLLETMGILFGRLRGGLAISVVVVGALLAASTGVVGASVVTMGVLALPVMLKYNYDKSLASGVVASAGTLGQIIPPSIVLVILGDQIGVSVGELFLGALIPGFLLAGIFVLWVVFVAITRPRSAPALPPEARALSGRALALRVLLNLIPPLFLILVVLGSIFMGIATPTEAGAMGAIGAMLLALVNRRLTLSSLTDTMDQTVKLTSMVFIILVGATAFSMVFTALNGDRLVEDFLLNLPGGQWGFLFFTMLVLFLLGFFIDFIEITFIVVPLIAPIALRFFGPEMMVWFGVVIAMNLQSSFLTPPFGFALFYLKGVAPPEVRTLDIYRGIVPFIVLQLLALLLIVLYPPLVTWLPSISFSR